MTIMHRRVTRGKAQTATSAHPSTSNPAALDAAAVHVYGLARGGRVSGAALAELLLNRGSDR